MIIYQRTKKEFIEDVDDGIVEDKIREEYKRVLKKDAPKAEFRSWMNSMQYMQNVMHDSRIPEDSEVAIEYRVPNTNKRVDFIITGENEDGVESAVVIELKQWDQVQKVESKDAIVTTFVGGANREVPHPSYQAWSYVSLIEDYNEDVRNYKINLKPCAYLHNYKVQEEDDLFASCYDYYIDKAPIFTRKDTKKLRDFISRYINKGNAEVMYHIENGHIKPSKALQDTLVSLLDGNKEFSLIDEQKVIFESIVQVAKENRARKQVYIVHGGPGTGKSVLAINLLVEILRNSLNTIYVTKNSAPRNVYTKMLTNGKYRKVQVDNLFKSSGSFVNASENDFDCIIVDEAHRLNAKTGMFQKGENQIKEIINASRISIFFVDDNQKVTLKDIGSTEEIKKWCNYYKAEVYEDTLLSQFRCDGSDSYLAWLDYALGVNDHEPLLYEGDYDIRFFDNPNEVMDLIKEKNKVKNKSRMVAGYCWEWIKEGKNDSNIHDIVIDDFKYSWNLGNSTTWAIDSDSVNEIGCIHTCQGLEFDYVGVIIGDDLRFENGQVITDYSKRAKSDKSLNGLKKRLKDANDKDQAMKDADSIIRNTYRTLMTRGQKGCYVYCTDKNLEEYLKNMFRES